MSQNRARLLLQSYRWLGAALSPFLGAYLLYRGTRGKEDRARRRERFGFASLERPSGPVVWIHAVSVGETTAIAPIIDEMLQRGIEVVLTTATVTSTGIAEKRFGDRIAHQYVPLDLKPAVSRFLDHWRPDLAVIVETEIFPMILLELEARRMPRVLVNGRMSDRSFAAWRRNPHLAEALFENLSLVVAQSEEDAHRFRTLGARPVIVSGNLKVYSDLPPFDAADLRRLKRQAEGRAVWVAVSTHAGEEEIAAEAHGRLDPRHRALTVIVPRHPDRAGEIERMLLKRGLTVARRSRGAAICPRTDVYLGDTMGEMGLYLNLADIAFVGRSLTASGGQNPLEPAMLGCAILSGRNVQNFRDTYRQLMKNGGVRIVGNAESLAQSVNLLIGDRHTREKLGRAARMTVEELGGALPLTVRALEPYIKPLTFKAELLEKNRRSRRR